MSQFTYTIQDNVGIHARPAGSLAKAAKALDSVATIEKAGGRAAAATKLMAVMGLGVKCGDTVICVWRTTGSGFKTGFQK